MSERNNYQHYNLRKQKRNSAVVASFAGVDFSSQSFNVSTSRAINIKNFMFKDGVVQKRNGYEELVSVGAVKYFKKDFENGSNTGEYNVNGVNINAMWKFLAEDGLWHIIAHIGNLLFEIKNINDVDNIEILPLICHGDETAGSGEANGQAVSNYPLLYKFEDYKSFAFVGANRLWFLGGNKFMCVRFTNNGLSFYPVANRFTTGRGEEDTFIPTTSYNITYENAIVKSRALLDFPNKLSMMRRNKLLSGVGKSETEQTTTKYFEYVLDAPLLVKNSSDIDKISVVITERGEK